MAIPTGYKYERVKCPLCGKEVADNWYVRHMRQHAKRGERKEMRED